MASPHEAAAPFPQPTQSTLSVAGLKGISLHGQLTAIHDMRDMVLEYQDIKSFSEGFDEFRNRINKMKNSTKVWA